jgi:hypothetical protein
MGRLPLVVGGIIPPEDEAALKRRGVTGVYTPKGYDLTAIITDIVELIASEPRLAPDSVVRSLRPPSLPESASGDNRLVRFRIRWARRGTMAQPATATKSQESPHAHDQAHPARLDRGVVHRCLLGAPA